MKTKIALCQLSPVSSSTDRNLSTMVEALKKCAQRSVQLCIFPEDFLHGILRGERTIEDAGRKFPEWVNIFINLANKYNIDLIPGSFPRYEKGKLYNTSVYISRTGRVLNQYSKTNLWLSERLDYQPSLEAPKVFRTPLGKTFLIICWDILDHKLFESAVKQGAEWIINIAFWSANQSHDFVLNRGKPKHRYVGYSDSQIIDSMIQARVAEYNVGMIFCNFAKIHTYEGRKGADKAVSAGHTQILSPLNKVKKKINNRNEKILIYDVPNIKPYIQDNEMFYGRREDIKENYPYRLQNSLS